MIFTSFGYLFIFLPVVFIFYWAFCRRSKNLQNAVLLLAGVCFYSLVEWKFLVLLFVTVLSTYHVANQLNGRGLPPPYRINA
jgi:D-alanyl-lipoteichoic acid acyltransferase DltB (MBOAT superfamily)